MNKERLLYYLSLVMYTVLLTWAILMNLNIFYLSVVISFSTFYGYIKFRNYKLINTLVLNN